MNFSVLDFFKFASRMLQIAQILVMTYQNFFQGACPRTPPTYFLFFFFFSLTISDSGFSGIDFIVHCSPRSEFSVCQAVGTCQLFVALGQRVYMALVSFLCPHSPSLLRCLSPTGCLSVGRSHLPVVRGLGSNSIYGSCVVPLPPPPLPSPLSVSHWLSVCRSVALFLCVCLSRM